MRLLHSCAAPRSPSAHYVAALSVISISKERGCLLLNVFTMMAQQRCCKQDKKKLEMKRERGPVIGASIAEEITQDETKASQFSLSLY